MAGEYFFAKSKKDALNYLKTAYPQANSFMVDRSKAFDKQSPLKEKKLKGYYGIADIVDKNNKILWHN